MKILLIDNYDSFTYNLLHYLEGFDANVDVFRNDEIPFGRIGEYNKVVLSPGPGLPAESGDLMKFIEQFATKKPMLGVCLGFQALAEHFGGSIYNQNEVKHGVAETCIIQKNSRLFNNLPEMFKIGLYHSWAVKKEELPEDFMISGISENDVIMAFEHKTLPVCGVQFHPESILTEHGHKIVENFICNFNS